MSDSEEEKNKDYKYRLEIKNNIAYEEFITEIEEACSDFVELMRNYTEYTDSELYMKIKHHLFSVKVFELVNEIFLN